jgi:hypothetical protein
MSSDLGEVEAVIAVKGRELLNMEERKRVLLLRLEGTSAELHRL